MITNSNIDNFLYNTIQFIFMYPILRFYLIFTILYDIIQYTKINRKGRLTISTGLNLWKVK